MCPSFQRHGAGGGGGGGTFLVKNPLTAIYTHTHDIVYRYTHESESEPTDGVPLRGGGVTDMDGAARFALATQVRPPFLSPRSTVQYSTVSTIVLLYDTQYPVYVESAMNE